MPLKFPKNEKLKSRKTIETLFSEGKSLKKYPLRLLYTESEGAEITQAAFAVPKRTFKLAVTRNRIKRQMREAYRLQKQTVLTNNGRKFALLFLYIGTDAPNYETLEKATKNLLKTLDDEKH